MSLILLGGAVAIAAIVSTTPPLLAGVLMLVIFVLAMYQLSSLPEVSVTWETPPRAKVGDEFEVFATLGIKGGFGIIDVELPVPDQFDLVDDNNVHVVFKGYRNFSRKISYRVRAMRRGVFDFGTVRYTYYPTLGIINRTSKEYSESHRIEVYPNIPVLPRMGRSFKTPMIRPSGSVSRLGPVSTDFDSIRDYQFGDPYRTINWKASARTGGLEKLYVNQYVREGTKTVMFLIDNGKWMTQGTPDDNSLEYSISLVLSYSRMLLENGVNTGVGSINPLRNQPGGFVLPGSGQENFMRIRNFVLKIEAETAARTGYSVKQAFYNIVRETSASVVLTTFVTDYNLKPMRTLVKRLAAYSHNIILIDVLPYAIVASYSHSPFALLFSKSIMKASREELYAELRGQARIVTWEPVEEKFGKIIQAVGKVIS